MEDAKGLVSPTLIGNRLAGTLGFNQVTLAPTAKALAAKQAPAAVEATETGPGEITLTWQPVEDATAYAIGRAVGKDSSDVLSRVTMGASSHRLDARGA